MCYIFEVIDDLSCRHTFVLVIFDECVDIVCVYSLLCIAFLRHI
jgi:hypothetical protein